MAGGVCGVVPAWADDWAQRKAVIDAAAKIIMGCNRMNRHGSCADRICNRARSELRRAV